MQEPHIVSQVRPRRKHVDSQTFAAAVPNSTKRLAEVAREVRPFVNAAFFVAIFEQLQQFASQQ